VIVGNFTNSVKWKKTSNGSLECQVRISLNPSGMAHINGAWPMKDDLQVIGNITELLREGRKQM
jgi:hypothetical protein